MHQYLALSEVQSSIFQNFQHVRDAVADLDSMRTLAILARTCPAFTEAALETLWHSQATIAPLVQVIPSNLWRIYSTQSRSHVLMFTGAPASSDWERFEYYARKVHVLGFYSLRGPVLNIHENVMTTLASHRPADTLLPKNTRNFFFVTVRYTQPQSPDSHRSMRCLLSSALTHVVLTEDHATLGLITAIRQTCPNIETMDIQSYSQPPTALVTAITDLFRCNQLRYTISACCRQSRNLLREDWWSMGYEYSHRRTILFRVFADSISQSNRSRKPSATQFNNLTYHLVQHPCRSSLSHIRLLASSIGFQSNPNQSNDAPNMRGLFLLPAIESIDIHPELGLCSAIDDTWLATAASTWPHLRALKLGETSASPQGQIPLIRSCTLLNEISFISVYTYFDGPVWDQLLSARRFEHISTFDIQLEGEDLDMIRAMLEAISGW